MYVKLPPVVITATRGEKALANVPVPTTLISKESLAQKGNLRLSDALAEQPGLQLVYNHGKGIQLQGLASDYTLVLIDGQPVIGRVAGTLDLDRLAVAGIERIEVVRGPSSSLYGSEALAGVINIITRQPEVRWATSFRSRYETHGTTDLNLEGETRHGPFGARLFMNRFSSLGYDFAPETIGQTVPEFTDYTLGGRFDVDLSDATQLNLSMRAGFEDQSDEVGLLESGTPQPFNSTAKRRDWNINPSLVHRWAQQYKLTVHLYGSRFLTDSQVRADDSNALESRSRFDQSYAKAEGQLDAVFGTQHLFSVGGGYIAESVEADRIAGARQNTGNVFAFVQHEWIPSNHLDLIVSARFDAHTDYAANLSPKAALLVKPNDTWRVRASVGRGFKAPTFQQLYLDFTNATAGYSVFGSVDAAAAIQALANQGQVQSFLTDLNTLAEIEPEHSWSFNLGVEGQVLGRVDVQVNAFRNNVSDLIEAAPVALKTNGQSAFTYFNLNRIVTQGVDVSTGLDLNRAWSIGASYQFLDTFDRDVVDGLEAGSYFARRGTQDVRLSRSDYGGLMNRSRHTGTLRLTYQYKRFTAAARAIYRGRYGFGDVNGNLILDDDREYVDGYWLLHLTLTQRLTKGLLVQVGGQNLADHTNHTLIPSLPGRLLFASLQADL